MHVAPSLHHLVQKGTSIATVQEIAAATPAEVSSAPDPPPNPPVPPPLGVAGNAPPRVAAVYNALDFQRAFHQGVRDIEIRDHVDLRYVPIINPAGRIVDVGNTDWRRLLRIGVPGPSTRSVRVCAVWGDSMHMHAEYL